ncbi:uncharacterized protein [Bemisia tabaci]|uniref:uncharacterized protein n=1 Tax=Bemisia tabaci TaxID=7038 RepID=UPI003B28996D
MDERWEVWKAKFEIFMCATTGESDTRRNCLLLQFLGDDAYSIYASFNKKYDELTHKQLIELFDAHFKPEKNVEMALYKLITRKQKEDETLDEFVTNLKNLSLACNLDNQRDKIVEAIMIANLLPKFEEVRIPVLMKQDETLENAIKTIKTFDASRRQVQEMDGNEPAVGKINRRYQDNGRQSAEQRSHRRTTNSAKQYASGPKHKGQSNWRYGSSKVQADDSRRTGNYSRCKNCGDTNHYSGRCPAIGRKCDNCNGSNHFSRVCKNAERKVRLVDEESIDSDDYYSEDEGPELFIGAIESKQEDDQWYVTLNVNDYYTNFLVDTGAQANVIPANLSKRIIGKRPILKTNVKLTSVTGEKMQVVGECNLKCVNEQAGEAHVIKFIVADINTPPILGYKTCKQLGVLQQINVIADEYKPIVHQFEVFKGIDRIKNCKCKIKINDNAKPTAEPPRKIPHKLRRRVWKELQRMMQLGVIERVTEPTEWVNPIATVSKPNGEVRICLDPHALNKEIITPKHYIPTLEDVKAKLKNSTVFTTLDAKSAFWALELDEESSKLTTFATPFGRFKFLRLAFGLTCASEMFQSKMYELFGDFPNLIIYIDDFLIYGDKKTHDETLKRNNNKRESLLPHEIADYLYKKVGMDYMDFNKDLYIVIVDYYSQSPEIAIISSTKASSLITRVEQMKKYHKGHGELSEFQAEDPLFFKKLWKGAWEPGKIVKKCKQPRSYVIESKNRKQYRRNRLFIKPKKDCQNENNLNSGYNILKKPQTEDNKDSCIVVETSKLS